MEEKPQRYQRSRAKGWKMPPNSVYVGRPSKWGNPFKVGMPLALTRPISVPEVTDAFHAVALFREWWRQTVNFDEPFAYLAKRELRGKNLVCWCRIVDATGNKVPCHADVLLEWANE